MEQAAAAGCPRAAWLGARVRHL